MSATTPLARSANGRLQGDVDDDDEGIGRRTSGGVGDTDADFDNDSPALVSKAYHDADDRAMVTWGRPAPGHDRQAIAAVIRTYLRAAAGDEAVKACSLIYTLYAESIPEDYGQPPGPPSLRGTTCEAVLAKLFRQEHAKLVGEAASLHVTSVRVLEKQGRALVGFTTAPAAYLSMQLERGTWRVDGVVPVSLP